jgi:hypothetical protein
MSKRFTSLRVIGTIFRVLAWISLILGVLGSVILLILGITLGNQESLLGVSLGGPLVGIVTFFVILLVAMVCFLSLYAIGESIFLLLALEDNTRRSAYLLQQQYTASLEGYPPPNSDPDPEY